MRNVSFYKDAPRGSMAPAPGAPGGGAPPRGLGSAATATAAGGRSWGAGEQGQGNVRSGALALMDSMARVSAGQDRLRLTHDKLKLPSGFFIPDKTPGEAGQANKLEKGTLPPPLTNPKWLDQLKQRGIPPAHTMMFVALGRV